MVITHEEMETMLVTTGIEPSGKLREHEAFNSAYFTNAWKLYLPYFTLRCDGKKFTLSHNNRCEEDYSLDRLLRNFVQENKQKPSLNDFETENEYVEEFIREATKYFRSIGYSTYNDEREFFTVYSVTPAGNPCSVVYLVK